MVDFIVIGAMKAGTGSLYAHLSKHPQIGMSRVKETDYFSAMYRTKEISWYEQMFSHHGSEKKIFGEASPNYTKKHLFPGTAKRISETLPNVKLIYITREPIERIESHLHHNLFNDRLKPGMQDVKVLENDHYYKTSCYFYQISEYLKYFQRDQILLLEMEGLKRDNIQKTLNIICDFLGVEHYVFDGGDTNAHRSSEKYFVKNKSLASKILPTKLFKLYAKYYRKRNIKFERPELEKETIKKLRSFLDKDYKKFRSLYNEK